MKGLVFPWILRSCMGFCLAVWALVLGGKHDVGLGQCSEHIAQTSNCN